MNDRAEPIAHWLAEPPVKDQTWALFWVVSAVAVPTALREAVDGIVSGSECIPYVPFVLLAAIFLGARHAAAVALISALVASWEFLGRPHVLFEASDLFGVGILLLASALIIMAVELSRRALKESVPSAPEKNPAGIVFSLEQGQAWVSWYGQKRPVRLGPEREVAEMMEDFLAQLEVAKRLTAARR